MGSRLQSLRYENDGQLPSLIAGLTSTHKEGPYWDFKREWHRDKAKLLHDIICLANNPEGEVALLIIGIDESADYTVYDLNQHPDNRMNTQQLNDMLHKVRWADAVPPVRVASTFLEDGCLDTIIIEPDDEGVPYRLNADYTYTEKRNGKTIGKTVVRAGTIYSREQDSNVPVDSTASPLATERLWRRHFGLDKTPLERLPRLLKDPRKWQRTWPVMPRDDGGGGYSYYHEDFPEFTFVRKYEEDKGAYEYFMLASPFFDHPHWWQARFYYHQTMLCFIDGAYSDHLWIPAPTWSTIGDWRDFWDFSRVIHYGYYLANSIEDVLISFELDESKEGKTAQWDLQRVRTMIPVFQDRAEKDDFERWVLARWDYYLECCKNQQKSFLLSKRTGKGINEEIASNLEKQARCSTTLVDLLAYFRLSS